MNEKWEDMRQGEVACHHVEMHYTYEFESRYNCVLAVAQLVTPYFLRSVKQQYSRIGCYRTSFCQLKQQL